MTLVIPLELLPWFFEPKLKPWMHHYTVLKVSIVPSIVPNSYDTFYFLKPG